MKILLTGATGYIGRYLLQALLRTENQLVLLLRDDEKIKPIIKEYSSKVTPVFLSGSSWKEQLSKQKPEVVVHLASYLTSADDGDNIDRLIEANISFGTHLLDALKDTPPALFINTGSFSEYSGKECSLSPAYLYAATKTAFRSVLQYYQKLVGFKLVNVIPYTVYGGKGEAKKLIDYIYESLDASTAQNMSPGGQLLDFIHINDVVDGYEKLIQHSGSIETTVEEFHLGTGTGTTPRQLARLMEEATGKKTNICWGAKPYRPLDTLYAVAPHSTLAGVVGWKPSVSLEQGIQLEYNKI